MDATRTAAIAERQPRTVEMLRSFGILPILTVASVEQARAQAEALLRGGLRGIEVTLRTPPALDAITALKRSLPELKVGAGTVLAPEQLRAAEDAGADFIVTPGTTESLREALAASVLPSVPGAATPSELMTLAGYGFRVAKLFPASAVGGLAMLKALQGPLAEFQFCPTGGLGEAEAASYLALQNVACIGGSWMLSDDPAEITRRASQCRTLVDNRKVGSAS
jgi:2-dehydro-3-deoxyphosphogluconate aldolase/(4S)-4-hydroxy-2-oxoglutarate aldolase